MRQKLWMATCLTSAALIVAIVGVPAAVVGAPASAANSLRVCPSPRPECPFTSIQSAIDAASPGSTITITGGTYKDNIVFGPNTATPLSLVAEGDAVRRDAGEGQGDGE